MGNEQFKNPSNLGKDPDTRVDLGLICLGGGLYSLTASRFVGM